MKLGVFLKSLLSPVSWERDLAYLVFLTHTSTCDTFDRPESFVKHQNAVQAQFKRNIYILTLLLTDGLGCQELLTYATNTLKSNRILTPVSIRYLVL